MANLIIKSTANDLVIQGSDASPAITVGTTGTTTFAENVTLSGTANNLGTVTAGSIAGGSITSATTFPAGHVLQVRYLQRTSGTSSTSSTTYRDFNGLVDAITPVATSSPYSKMYITANAHMYLQGNASDIDRSVNFQIEQTISGGATSIVWNSSNDSNDYSFHWWQDHDSTYLMMRTPIACLVSPGTASEITYQIQYNSGFGSAVMENSAYGRSEITIMEVAG